MHFEEEIKLLLSSRHLIIYIITDEEERLEYTISQITQRDCQYSIYSWDFIDGYYNNPNYVKQAIRNPLGALEFIDNLESKTPKIFFLKDFHVFINDISIIRKLKNLYRSLKKSNSHIVICASEIQIPILLRENITLLEFPLPNYQEIKAELKRLFSVLQMNSDLFLEDLVIAYKGFSIERIRRSIAKVILSDRSLDDIINIISEEKKQLIQQTDILEFYNSTNKLEDIGGLVNLKDWLTKRTDSFSKQAQNYGIPSPRGVLLVGIQGTGKSLSAKAISQHWGIPLLKLDVGKIFAGIVGQSEERMRSMIKLSEQSAPCILWIDEIDKAFTKLTSSNDSGTTNRILSSLLTWLSEKESQVFIVATANNVLSLPAELLRKGRFDEIFFLDLPNFQERSSIFQIHLMKVRPLTWRNYNIAYLSNLTDNFSGAEIKQAIIEAMHNAFYEKRDFTTEDISIVIHEFIPLSFTDQESIYTLQSWAKSGKIRFA
uniref:Uncharacterized AAA domain-containing protein ycf46 n=1 Tax=Schimmelmannia schousboei TaxID=173468 RepID=A0A1C9C8S2_9FLOR|nr:hypothetical protein Schim_105 [Schimmelmannia schousboei]AOM64786.1 hypothetical protein Schim_105 [Schimmelmannia schousboei]